MADKPLFVTDRHLHSHEITPRGIGDALISKLEGQPYGTTRWGVQLLLENPRAVTELIRRLGYGRQLDELSPEWKILGSGSIEPLTKEWDPCEFLNGLTFGCMHNQYRTDLMMSARDIIAKAKNLLGGRAGLSISELYWFLRYWKDSRIPAWFRDRIESGRTVLIATDTTMLRRRAGGEGYIFLCYLEEQISCGCLPLDHECASGTQVLVPS